MSPSWETTADWDAAQSETGVHHEQPASTDWAASDVMEKGYPTFDLGGNALLGYYPLDENSGSTANEVSGGSLADGSISGATVGQSGVLGTTGYSFDGTDDEVAGMGDFNTDSDFTIACWVYPRSPNSKQKFVYKFSSGFDGALLGMDQGGDLTCKVFSPGSNLQVTGSGLAANTWQHVALAWDESATQATLYLDGAQDAQGSDGGVTDSQGSGGQMAFGLQSNSSVHYYDGILDEVRIYGRTLSGTNISNLYQAAL